MGSLPNYSVHHCIILFWSLHHSISLVWLGQFSVVWFGLVWSVGFGLVGLVGLVELMDIGETHSMYQNWFN